MSKWFRFLTENIG